VVPVVLVFVVVVIAIFVFFIVGVFVVVLFVVIGVIVVQDRICKGEQIPLVEYARKRKKL
jgi:hypothetical protein